jgi:hypothetical protein
VKADPPLVEPPRSAALVKAACGAALGIVYGVVAALPAGAIAMGGAALFLAFIAFGFSDSVPKSFSGKVRDSVGRPIENPIALGRLWFIGWLGPLSLTFGVTCVATAIIRILAG